MVSSVTIKSKPDNMDIILEARQISKTFPGVKALDNISLMIQSGKVNVLVGENGAGKSTLIKILSGVYTDYEGQILLEGQEVSFSNPRQAQDMGISIIHQELNLIPYLSVAENIFLGREPANIVGLVDYGRMYHETRALLRQLDMDIEPQNLIADLRVGQQQIVEIAKALSIDARIIIMDEPTSAIGEHEIDILTGLIQSLAQNGVAIIYITHKLDELFRIADHITVLRDGRLIDSCPLTDLTRDDIVRMMVGRDMKDYYVKDNTVATQEILKAEDISLVHPERPDDYLVDHVSFNVKRGEVLGISGLMGAGRTELLETIFGMHPGQASGRVYLESREVKINSPQKAIQEGIGFIPEDRKEQGLVLMMSVCDNISLASLSDCERYCLLQRKREKELAFNFVNSLRIKTPDLHQRVENLSGGNQQKVVIAKWLATNPKVLFLDEPTRGIDVNAKNEIYRLIGSLTREGMGIVMISSELPEILAISDRILVLSEGKMTGEFTRGQATEELIMKAAIPKSS